MGMFSRSLNVGTTTDRLAETDLFIFKLSQNRAFLKHLKNPAKSSSDQDMQVSSHGWKGKAFKVMARCALFSALKRRKSALLGQNEPLFQQAANRLCEHKD
jgi:hypothetical protein